MKKRLQRIAKISFYTSLTIMIVVVTVFLVTIGRGYLFDFRTGRLSGGGLILSDSKPSGAEIFLNNKRLGKSTPARIPLKADTYQLRLERNDYRTWQKSLDVVTSEVTWAKYPVLVPTQLEPSELFSVPQPVVSAENEKADVVAIASTGSQPKLQVLEAGQETPRTILALTPEQIQQGYQFDSLQWSPDNEHILVGLRNAQGVRYIVLSVVNTQDTIDISQDFSLPLGNLQFSDQNWREIYWLSPEGLRKLDLANRTVSAVLATPVSSYAVTEEAVFFIRPGTTSAELVRLERDNQLTVLVDDLPLNSYSLQYAKFDDTEFVALLNQDSKQVWLYYNPQATGQNLHKFENTVATKVDVGPNDRYLVMQNGSSFVTFDLEFDRTYHFSLPVGTIGPITWYDDYHMLAVADGQAVMFEFDGGNFEQLAASAPGYRVFGARSKDLIYTFLPQAEGTVSLEALDLVL